MDRCPHHHDENRDAVVATTSAPQFWRSLEELAQTSEFRERVEREFPHAASVWNDPPTRRRFLALMGASVALAGLNGCYRKPTEKIVPYVIQPEQLVQGKP